jgi:uncharacterized repeat protein (TIGR01451 family)
MRKSVQLWNACLLLVALLLLVSPAQAAPPAQDPVVDEVVAPDTSLRVTLGGTAVNWGYRNEPDLHVILDGGGWMVETSTGSEGQFSFDNLGEGVAVLNPHFPDGSGLQAMTTDLAVPLASPNSRTVNLGIYGGEQYPTGLPLSIDMVPSVWKVGPGDTVSFTVSISNNMPNDIHQVIVTDMFPEELTPTAIESSVGVAWIGGQFAAADLGDIGQGQGAVIEIAAVMDPNLDPDDIVTNRAGVLYNESVALQAKVTLNDESMMPETLPDTGVRFGLPLGAAVVLLGAIVGLRRMRLIRSG